jgi:cation:H+ antiporter
MLTEYLIAIGGVLGILILADIIVKISMRLAKHWGLSGTFVGLTILSIGTSIPEIMSAIIASVNILKDPASITTLSGLVIGQNVGSDIFQQMFVLSLVGLIGTIVVVKQELKKEVGALIAGAALVLLFAIGGTLHRVEGAVMVVLYIGYLGYLYFHREKQKVRKKERLSTSRLMGEFAIVVLAFIAMGWIADKVLGSASHLVATLPISASFLGVVMLGVASALPELTTALVAIFKKEKGVSAGVLIGSNITNPMMGLGLGALISGYTVPSVVVLYDLPVKIATGILIFYFLWRNERLNKWEAIMLMVLFATYLLVRQTYFPGDII